jgi:hypothetical protein
MKLSVKTYKNILGAVVLALLINGCGKSASPEKEPQKDSAETKQETAIASVQKNTEPPTAQEAVALIGEIDQAIKDANSMLKNDYIDLSAKAKQSQRMNELLARSERFGQSIFEEPFGRCFGAGNNAQSWWMARLSTLDHGGISSNPGWAEREIKQYKENRASCLKAAKGR